MPQPFPEALQEFKVETSSLPAQYGDHAAAAVNAVTRSGTNKFHGSAFDYLRNYDAQCVGLLWQLHQSPYKDGLKRNQFGGTIGGPIMKDKLFFFGALRQPSCALHLCPPTRRFRPSAMMNGDFSTVTSATTAGGCQKQGDHADRPVRDDRRRAQPASGGAAAMSPQALAAMKYIPIAGSASTPDVTALATGQTRRPAAMSPSSSPPTPVRITPSAGSTTPSATNTGSSPVTSSGINNQPIPADAQQCSH
jgi:hypothetical protein